MITSRLFAAVSRRINLFFIRLTHPRASFGPRCDIRSRFTLRQDPLGRVRLGERCIIDNDMTMEVHGALDVGSRTIFGHHCTLAARQQIYIGADCLIAELVSIRDHDHCFDRLDIPVREQRETVEPVRIGNNVWLGAKVTVVKGVTIGDNVIVGANAVVTRDIPPNSIAAGVPARVIRSRLDGSGRLADVSSCLLIQT